jgi:hypothetical protein
MKNSTMPPVAAKVIQTGHCMEQVNNGVSGKKVRVKKFKLGRLQ